MISGYGTGITKKMEFVADFQEGAIMRILTNVSKAELNYLANQPTAKAMIEKVKTEGIYIAEGDVQGAAAFAAMRDNQKEADSLQISDEGRAALKKDSEAKEKTSQEEQIKEKISELKKELTEIKLQQAVSEKAKMMQDKKANAIEQQISMLSMQLIQLQKANSQSDSI